MTKSIRLFSLVGFAVLLARPAFGLDVHRCLVGYGNGSYPFIREHHLSSANANDAESQVFLSWASIMLKAKATEDVTALNNAVSQVDRTLALLEQGIETRILLKRSQDVLTTLYGAIVESTELNFMLQRGPNSVDPNLARAFRARLEHVKSLIQDPAFRVELADAGLKFGPEVLYLPERRPLPPEIFVSAREIRPVVARYIELKAQVMSREVSLKSALTELASNVTQVRDWILSVRSYARPDSHYDAAEISGLGAYIQTIYFGNDAFYSRLVDEAYLKIFSTKTSAQAAALLAELESFRVPIQSLVQPARLKAADDSHP